MKMTTKNIIVPAAVLLTLCSFAACSDSQEGLSDDRSLQVQTAIGNTEADVSMDQDIPDNAEDKNTAQEEADDQIQDLIDSDSEESHEQAVINYDNYTDEVTALMDNGLAICAPDESYEWAVSDGDDFTEASEKYIHLLESFMDSPENYKSFCGGYYQNGYLHLLITGKETEDVFLDVTGSENVIVKEADYSHTYLNQVYKLIDSMFLDEDGYTKSYMLGKYTISEFKNRVLFTASSQAMEENVYAAVEAGGYDKNSVEVTIGDFVYANPL